MDRSRKLTAAIAALALWASAANADPMNARAAGSNQWLDGDGQASQGQPFIQRITPVQPSTKGDSTITTGGTPQVLFGGVVPKHGWKVANPDPTEDLWCSDSTATPAANGAGSILVFPGGGQYSTEPGEAPWGAVYCVAVTTGHRFVARSW